MAVNLSKLRNHKIVTIPTCHDYHRQLKHVTCKYSMHTIRRQLHPSLPQRRGYSHARDYITVPNNLRWSQILGGLHKTGSDLYHWAIKRSTTDPNKKHFQTLKVTIRYLQGTRETGITYPTGQKRPPTVLLLQFYVCVFFSGDTQDRKSTTGIDITYNGASIAWTSKNKTWSHYLLRRLNTFPCLWQSNICE